MESLLRLSTDLVVLGGDTPDDLNGAGDRLLAWLVPESAGAATSDPGQGLGSDQAGVAASASLDSAAELEDLFEGGDGSSALDDIAVLDEV